MEGLKALGRQRTGEKKFSPAFFMPKGRYPTMETGLVMRYRCVSLLKEDELTPIHRPSQEELDSLNGKGFRCVSCLRRRPKSKLGGFRAGEPLCRSCYPYADDGDVRSCLAFDRYHGTI